MLSFLEPVFKIASRVTLRQLIIVCLVVVGIIFFILQSTAATEEPVTESTAATLPQVTLTSLQAEATGSSISLIGTVRAEAQAALTAEVSGQVTSVPVILGATVSPGQVIATLENRSERAAVTQAEGAYDAAVAAASQNYLGLDTAERALTQAKQQAISTVKAAYTTVNSTIRSNIDPFFASPTTSSVPGLRIDGSTQFLNSTRVQFQSILPAWEKSSNALTIADTLTTPLQDAYQNTELALSMVDAFIEAFSDRDNRNDARYDIPSIQITFTNLRTDLVRTLSDLESAEIRIADAVTQVAQTEQTTMGGENSSADAQIKQALGSLQAAEANLAKTIIRSPIQGTITDLDVRTGDFVNSGATLAAVANTNALEIITFAGQSERAAFAVGDTVRIDEEAEGRVAAISPAINQATGKTEIRIYTNSDTLTNGDSVRVYTSGPTTSEATSNRFIPITAVKFTADNSSILQVDETNTLYEQPVTLGTIRADLVEVVTGLTPTDTFVKDARGVTAGDTVNIRNQ